MTNSDRVTRIWQSGCLILLLLQLLSGIGVIWSYGSDLRVELFLPLLGTFTVLLLTWVFVGMVILFELIGSEWGKNDSE